MSTMAPQVGRGERDALQRAVTNAIQHRRLDDARALCDRLETVAPEEPDAWVFRARIDQRLSLFVSADHQLTTALEKADGRWDVHLVAAEGKIYTGDIAQALAMLRSLRPAVWRNAAALGRMAALFTQVQRHDEAHTCAKRAREIEPSALNWLLLEASTSVPIGQMNEAEALMDRIISAMPREADVYYNRSTLRQQTKHDNHVDELRQVLSRLPSGDPRVIPVSYALGKELEDLGEFAESYAFFERGAQRRRSRLSYQVATDVAAIDHIIQVFDDKWFVDGGTGSSDAAPIFVMGLPRSGTTLVDRILSTHCDVDSLGEVSDVAYAVTRLSSPADSKTALIARSASLDLDRLGDEIADAFQGYGEVAVHLIDKTPANYLYLGLLARALPKATFVHVHRHPLASCFAMYKTLFRMGYPFSYDQTDLGHYYVAYRRLMDHWSRILGDRIFHIAYEAIVDNQEAESRRLFKHCGLEWSPASLDFHQNRTATATASAAQVRQPIYRSARDLWREHETRLAPVAAILEKEGIDA